ncbi:B12-binding domain-containing radical SAM protein [Streptomyces sp. NPDC006703]|uniref:B12-binding domain-containing radical SAM protein n=1 Tax=Streptomyces sp. NPDC006703 TaxID=3364759 RepID=UPI0036A10F11
MAKRRNLPIVAEDPVDHFTRYRNPGGFSTAVVHPFLTEAVAKNRLKYRESLALGYLIAALEAGDYPVESVNAELEFLAPEEVAERLMAVPDLGLLGISAKSQRTYRAAKQIAELVKRERPEVHVTVGGVFPSAAANEVLEDAPQIDSVVRGEGEYGITELAWRVATGAPLSQMRGLTYRQDGRPRTAPERPRIRDLDALPRPARRDLEWIIKNGRRGGHSAYLVASRGCYAACTFCSIHQIYGDHNVMRRSPGSIVEEMRLIGEEQGVRRFSFVDDLFIMPSPNGYRWVEEFCDQIVEAGLDVNFYAEMRADTVKPDFVRRLRDVGLHRLFIGVESGVDSVLKRWDKGTTVADNETALANLRETGMPPHAINFGYIMFDPEMSLAELREQFRWIKESGHCRVQHLQNKMNIYWGTPQYQRMIAQGRTDTAPLGDRWQYEFDDWRVGDVEAAVRWFHRRYESEGWSEPAIKAREAFLARVNEDVCTVPVPDWLFDLLNQAQRKTEGLERGLYYEAFEHAFAQVGADGRCDDDFREGLWAALLPRITELQEQSGLFEAFADALDTIRAVAPDEPVDRPATARLSADGTVSEVWVRTETALQGYRATPFHTGPDRCDHACTHVSYTVVDQVTYDGSATA